MKANDHQKVSGLYMRTGARRVRQVVSGGLYFFGNIFQTPPDRLIVAPTDLRAADPFVAGEIINGRFTLAGRTLETGGTSPFGLEMPSEDFEAKLHSFGWLRDFRATKDDPCFAKAQGITGDWIAAYRRPDKTIVWQPDIVAQRLIAWLSHSPVILRGAEMGFYRRFLKSLGVHVNFLKSVAATATDGHVRMRIRIALAVASLAMPAKTAQILRAGHHLDLELDRQILPDGGHVSRNPRVILELLLDLLPLRQTYVNLGHELPARLIPAVDRMFPALRFFRHQGGELALFNGATATLATELASVLRYDETSGQPFKALPYMQYQRLSVSGTVIIMDTGKAISAETSAHAHGGCLSFEMSSGMHRFIINSGAPRNVSGEYRQLARTTAAHSTVTINDKSSVNFSTSEYLGSIITGGVSKIEVTRKEEGQGENLTARHDGYLKSLGLLHERDLQLSSGGGLILGRDRLVKPDGGDPESTAELVAVARFHIHPSIQIRKIDKSEVLLTAPDGQAWSFSCIDTQVVIAEDVFFADPSGMRISQQLELEFNVAEIPEIQWVLEQKSQQKL